MKKERWFIIAPTEAGVDVGDNLHIVCSTKCPGPYLDIYHQDHYEEQGRHDSLKAAQEQCKRNGYKKPFVLA